MTTPAQLWRMLSSGQVQCLLCRHFCRLHAGEWGFCGVRVCIQKKDGTLQLITLVDHYAAAVQIDPVEKKPFYHFLPASRTLSLGTFGCNFDCAWCQNSNLSRPDFLFTPENSQKFMLRMNFCQQGYFIDPQDLAQTALNQNCASIAFTYNEPTIFFEMMKNCAVEARKAGLKTVLISNGYQSPACLKRMGPLIDAANIDLKSFSEQSYQKFCGAHLSGVLENLVQMRKAGWWLEITTLIIPQFNDSAEEFAGIARFIADNLGTETPWHLSVFFPRRYMSDRHITALESLQTARDIGQQAGLQHIYFGNITGQNDNTYCPQCHELLLQRHGYSTVSRLIDGKCPSCNHPLAGLW